jgi:uncharacterized membrane protein
MDVLVNVLFWIHLTALAFGGAAAFGIPVVGSRLPGATAEARPLLFSLADSLSMLGRGAIAALIVTGPLMVWLKYGGTAGFTWWFWAKMVLVVLLLIAIIYAGINAKRAESGDIAAARRAPMLGMTAAGIFVLVILCAVFAFN